MPVSLLSGFLQGDSYRRWVGDSGPLHTSPYSSNARTVALAGRLCFVCPSRADDLHDESNEMRAFFSCFHSPNFSSQKLPPPRLSRGYLWHSSKQSFASRDPFRHADRRALHLSEIRLPETLPALHPEQRIPPTPSLLLTDTPLALRDGPIEFLAVDPLLLENSSLRHSRHRHRRTLHSSNTNAIMLADCLHNTAGGLHNGHERIRNAGHQLLLNNRSRGHGTNETRDF